MIEVWSVPPSVSHRGDLFLPDAGCKVDFLRYWCLLKPKVLFIIYLYLILLLAEHIIISGRFILKMVGIKGEFLSLE